MNASAFPTREAAPLPIEPTPTNAPPHAAARGAAATIDAAAFAQMDSGQRLAHLRALLVTPTTANATAVDDWRRRNAARAEAAPAAAVAAAPTPAKAKSGSPMARRVVKTLLGLAVVAAVGYAPLQRLAQSASVAAIVNARVVTLRSPIDGQVQAGPAAAQTGAALAPGERLFRVVDPRADRSRVDDLARQLERARDDRPRLAARLDAAQTLLAALTEQTRAFGEARVRQLEARRDALGAAAAASHVRSQDAKATLERANWLAGQGAGAAVQAQQAKRDADVAAQNEIAALREIAANDVELNAARGGVFVGDSYNDRPSSAQRADDLRQQVVDDEQALAENDRRIARLQSELADERARYAELSAAEIVAPSKGSVWETLTAPGEQVRRGQELARVLDCSGALVTATVGESVYNRLRVGAPARFQPRDGGADLAGTVVALTGPSSTPANFAIEPAALTRGAYHVAVSIPGLAGGEACDVGRTGRVVFDGAQASLLDALRPALW